MAASSDTTSMLQAPISRAQLLTGLGGVLAATMTAGALTGAIGRSPAASFPHLVLIVLDGARPEYFNISGIPHVRSLMQNGTQYDHAFAGILESETPSAHVSIATGSQPSKTGIPSFWWANAENQRISLFSPDKIRAGDMEKIIRQSGVPTLARLVHAKSPRAQVVALSGSKYYAADALGGPDANVTMYFYGTPKGQYVPTYVPGHVPPAGLLSNSGLTYKTTHLPPGVEDHLAMKLAADTFNRIRQQVTLINLPEFDWPLGHVHGGVLDPAGIKTLMQGFDNDLAMLQDTYRKAGVLNNTIFVFMADHGMMPLSHKIPQSEIRAAVSKAGTSIVSEAYSSAAYLWLKDESRASLVARNLGKLNSPYIQSVYARIRAAPGLTYRRVSNSKWMRTDAIESANQYLLNSFNGPNAPDVVALFSEGVGCEPGGQSGWKADHGGTSWLAQEIPLILSGPGIRAGHVSSYPARLIDVAPTVLQAMGASYRGMQGIPLADALYRPPAGAGQRQQTASRQLIPVVTALQQQSRLELAARV